MNYFRILFFLLFLSLSADSKNFSLNLESKKNAYGIHLLEKYQEPRIDFYSFFDKKIPSSLALMKELRLQHKKTRSLYAQDKVLLIFDENDVIYESYEPPLGVFKSHYEISRMIKTSEGYLIISYISKEGKPPKKERDNALETLKSIHG